MPLVGYEVIDGGFTQTNQLNNTPQEENPEEASLCSYIRP